MKRILVLLVVMLISGMNAYASGNLVVDGSFNLLPAGTIVMYGGATMPEGWIKADGNCLLKTAYPALYAAIQNTYTSTYGTACPYPNDQFRLPDFQGVFPKGAGTTLRPQGIDANNNLYSAVLGTYSQDRFQGHKHPVKRKSAAYAGSQLPSLVNNPSSAPANTSTPFEAAEPIADGVNGDVRIGPTTEPQSLGVNFIIKY